MNSGTKFITMGYGLSFWTLKENNFWERDNIFCLE